MVRTCQPGRSQLLARIWHPALVGQLRTLGCTPHMGHCTSFSKFHTHYSLAQQRPRLQTQGPVAGGQTLLHPGRYGHARG